MGWWVCICLSSRGTAGKEVVLAGITWFTKGQGFDVVPSVEQQGSCRKADSQPWEDVQRQSCQVCPHKPAEVSHSQPVCSFHTPSSLSCLICQCMWMCVSVSVCALKTKWKLCLVPVLVCVSFKTPAGQEYMWDCDCVFAWLFNCLSDHSRMLAE